MNRAQIVSSELAQITTHRAYAELKAQNNILKARENTEYRELDTKIRAKKLALCKIDDPAEIKKLRKSISELKEKQASVLLSIGISPAALLPQYNCPSCHDTGYVSGNICSCLLTRVKARLAEQSGQKNWQRYSFDTSDARLIDGNPSLKKAYAVAKKYVAEFPNFRYKNLVLIGNVGAGKTYLIQCIAHALIERAHYVVFCTAFDLNRTIQSSFGMSALEREAMLAPYFESDLLVIDDLGSEPIIKNVTIPNLFSVINERENQSLPIIISTNLDMTEIQERYGDRIASRIFNKRQNLIIPFDGKDLRLN